ncbi:MAG: flagellar hook-basal body complex protein FliE [Myxococcota bacterium]|jgi:flagellar hook-basal body complex protein FliE
MAISSIGSVPTFSPISDALRTPAAAPSATPSSAPVSGGGFLEELKGALNGVETGLAESSQAITELSSGENVDLHGTMISMEKAEIALRMTVSARDKFIAAYEQIMNMAV